MAEPMRLWKKEEVPGAPTSTIPEIKPLEEKGIIRLWKPEFLEEEKELSIPRTELRAVPPGETIITVPELKTERKTIGERAFREKYPPQLVSFIEEEIKKDKGFKEGRVFYGGHEKVPGEEWIRRGLTFNRGPELPVETPVTFKEKALETAGWILGVTLLRHIASPLIGGILSKVPGAAQPTAKLAAEAAKHPWKVGWPLSIAKGAGWGAVLGVVEKPENKEKWLKQIAARAGTFAVFSAIAHPLIQFFRPVIYSVGRDSKMMADPKIRQMLGTEGMRTIYTPPKTLWFRHPTDPKIILKVTSERIDVLPFASAPPLAKPYPILGKVEVEAFKYDPSLYSRLKDFLKGIKISTPIKPPPVGASPGDVPTVNISPPGLPPPTPTVSIPPAVAPPVPPPKIAPEAPERLPEAVLPEKRVEIPPKAIPKELELLAEEARKYESAEEFVKKITKGYFRPKERLQQELTKYQDDLKNAQNLLKTATSEITLRDARRVIQDRTKRIKELSGATKGHEIIEQVEKAGFESLTDFYNQAVKEVKPIERVPAMPPPKPPKIKPVAKIETPPRPITRKAEVVELLSQQKKEIISVLRQKQKEIGDVKQQIVDYVKASIPLPRQGMYLDAVKRAETQRDLIETFTRVDKEVEKITTKTSIKELRNALKTISESKAIAIDYKQKIRNLIEPIEIMGHIQKTIGRLRTTEQFIKRQKELGKDVFMPEKVLESLKILKRKPIAEISNPEIQLLIGKIKDLERLGKTKLRTIRDLYEIEKERLLNETIKDAVPIEKQPIFKPPVGTGITLWQGFHNKFNGMLNLAQHIDLSLTPMDVWFDILDGSPGTYEGANYRTFKKTMDNDWGEYLNLKDKFIEPLWEIHDKYKLSQESRERLGVYSVAIQEGGMERLLKTGYTEEEIKNIILTPQEMAIYNHWAKWAAEIRPQIADLARELYNIELGEVENYFPFMTDFKAMSEAEIWKRFGEGMEEIGMPTKNVEIGFLKERVAPGKVKIDFMEVANKHMDNVSYFLAMAKDIRMLFEIANNPKFGEEAGELGQSIALEWIDLMSRKGGHAQGDRIAILDTLRKNIGAAILGFRLSSAMIQPTALIDGASLIGAKWVFRGAQDFVSDVRWRDLIRKLPEIKKRGGDDPAFLALSENKVIERWQEYGFKPLKYLDLMTAGGVATGAYQKYLHKHKIPVDFEKLHPEAAEYAQKWMRRTQSSAFYKDAPLAISRGRLTGNRSFDRAILQFQSFLLTRWSVIRHDAWRAGIKAGKTKKALHIYFWLLLTAVITEMGMRRASNELINFITRRPKRDDGFTKKFVLTLLGNVPFVSNALSVSVYGGEPMPVLEALKKPAEEVPKLWGEKEITKIRGLIGIAESVGIFMGMPGASQFGQIGRGWVKDMEKKEKIEFPKLPIPKIPKPLGI